MMQPTSPLRVVKNKNAMLSLKGTVVPTAAVDQDELVDPNTLQKLPERYHIVMSDPTIAERMHAHGIKLKVKHPNWSKQRLMRKIFAEFPSVRIKIVTDDVS